jgi:hypothetical protein
MSLADEHPTTLTATLERLGLSEMLTGYVPRAHVTRRVSWREFTRFVEGQGYEVVTERGNIYGKITLHPAAPTAPAPRFHVITRSDHAAVHGSRRGA